MPPPVLADVWKREAAEAWEALKAARRRGDELSAIAAEQRLNRALEAAP